jgi:hypothetical protein
MGMARFGLKVQPMGIFSRERSEQSGRSVRVLRDLRPDELDELFRAATTQAIEESVSLDIPLSGLDEGGRVIESYNPGSPRIRSEEREPEAHSKTI